jgi:hypothetical protein
MVGRFFYFQSDYTGRHLAQPLARPPQSLENGDCDIDGEILRQKSIDLSDDAIHAGQYLFDDMFGDCCAQPHLPGMAGPMAALYLVDVIMIAFPAYCHGQPGTLMGELMCSIADDRMRGQDVIQRGCLELAMGQVNDAEVLGMSIGGSQQPENELCFEKPLPITFSLRGTEQNLHDLRNPWPAISLVFPQRRGAGSLAKILLRQAYDPAAVM